MTDLVLHYAPDNASLCVRLALEAAGLPYVTRLVDRRASGHKSASYLQMNPNGLIPVLETPDGVLFETAAILMWIDEQKPGLMPTKGPERAQATKWLIWMANTLHPTLRMLFYPSQYIGSGHEAVLSLRTRDRLAGHLRIADEGLAGLPFVGASRASLLDCYLCPMLRWMQLYPKIAPSRPALRDYPTLLAIAQAGDTRPETARADAAEGLGPTPFSAPSYPNPPEGSAL